MNLYIIATPIGNLEDITYRAVRILNEVDIIFCENKNHSIILLNYYNISKPLYSLRSYNEERLSSLIINFLEQDKTIAYISDAGTPGISDPGNILISKVRKKNFKIIPIPGASALTTLLSLNSFPGKKITFIGFLSKKKNKRKIKLKESLQNCDILIVYEAPSRILELLEDLDLLFNDSVSILLARELTKKYEDVKEGSPKELIEYLKAVFNIEDYIQKDLHKKQLLKMNKKNKKINKIKGEYSLLISMNKNIN